MRLFRNKREYGQQTPMSKNLRCSFCGKHQDEVERLIAGPTVYICNECIDICNEIIADDNRKPEPSVAQVQFDDQTELGVQCSICRVLAPVTESLLIPERGQLCPACRIAVRSALDELEQSR